MIEGIFVDGQAAVTLRVRGPNGQVANVQIVVDTGFNDFLTLPSWAIQRLELPMLNDTDYVLADGTKADAQSFLAELEWMGTWHEVVALEIEGNPLLGTALMNGHHLGIDIVEGGRVEIQPLPPR